MICRLQEVQGVVGVLGDRSREALLLALEDVLGVRKARKERVR